MRGPTLPDRRSRPELVAGLFIAVTWAAAVFALFGLLAVLLDRDPVEQQVSSFYGVVSMLLAIGTVYVGIVLTVPRRAPWTGAAATGLAVYLIFLLSAAVVDLDFAIAQAMSPFVWAAAIIATVPPLASWFVFDRRR